MTLPVSRLQQLLKQQAGSPDVTDGYNYEALTLRVPKKSVAAVAKALRERKDKIEAAYEATYEAVNQEKGKTLTLLPFVCLTQQGSILVPTPWGVALNFVSAALETALAGEFEGVKFPHWG
jgi:cation transport regulator ChaC